MCARATIVAQEARNVRIGSASDITPIKMGVVGLGNRAVYNVLSKLVAYDEFALAAICDIRPDIVKRTIAYIQTEYGLKVRGYTDYDEMLQKEEMDAMSVQVDPNAQVPLVCKALEAGLHVMSEVPVTYSIQECWQLITTVERTKKVYLLMEQGRYAGYVQAWRNIVQKGVIGKPLFCEGEYFHYFPGLYFQDAAGKFYTPEQAQKNPDAKPTWRYHAPSIGYAVHDLSPLLHILEDRVVRVVGMSTRNQSYKTPNLGRADFQLAIMHTENDVVIRLATGFGTPDRYWYQDGGHWLQVTGSEGGLEGPRSSTDKHKFWVADWQLHQPLDVPWTHSRADAPRDAKDSGHGDCDYYTFAHFADSVLYGVPLGFDVYKAVETAAPAILAGQSIEQNNIPIDVPDFRPGPDRKPGQMPKGLEV